MDEDVKRLTRRTTDDTIDQVASFRLIDHWVHSVNPSHSISVHQLRSYVS